ncbi:hypothetical protein BK120_23485 [Paenibacillus sp. FSL A5-0031]|nr:cation transporter [Paenibacillus sp. FSL A5-0031]OME78702.1 hypothetical protein BK120_23485 [Paenibacillus sp. FSL A5-0031]
MSCQYCVNSIEEALTKIGVTGITGNVNLTNGTVDITYDENKLKLDHWSS